MNNRSAFETHKQLLRDIPNPAAAGKHAPHLQAVEGDFDQLARSYRFLRTEEDDKDLKPWQREIAQKYYSKLFREYAIVDLSRYKEGLLGCRWRTHDEVIAGKGQFVCGCKGCSVQTGLCSCEVPFKYKENGSQKHALVKVRLCPEHMGHLTKKSLGKVVKGKKHKHPSSKHHRDQGPESDKAKRLSTASSPVQPGKRKRDASPDSAAPPDADAFLSELLL